MRWSIRYRLLLPLLVLLLGVISISTWMAYAAARHAQERIAQQLRSVAQTLTESTFPLPRSVLEQMKGLSGADFVLVRPDGEQISTFTTAVRVLSGIEPLIDPDRLGPPTLIADAEYHVRRLPMGERSGLPGATLYICYPADRLRDALWDAVRPSLVLGLFGGLLSIGLTIGIGQRLVGRIRGLERRTRLIAAGDFSPMPLPRADDELCDLARSVNDMASQLTQLQEAILKSEQLRLIGQLSSGLAHQLRNGVTGARLAVQVHAQECPLGHDDALNVTLRQLALMEANLRRFLDLGQTDGWRRQSCDLRELIEEAITLLRPQCQHAQIDLRWSAPDRPASLVGDPGQLGHLFLNIVGNAVEAAGPGGCVEVDLQSGDDRHIIEVWDSGKGPPAELQHKLFEPFITGKPEGIGLGLAVAERAAQAHGGSIEWRREADRTCFRIVLSVRADTENRR